MSNTNTGGPAFPFSGEPGVEPGCSGMTLRDYFAAKAMPMIAAEIYSWKQQIEEPIQEITAKMAYEMADAMIKARDA